MMDDHSTTDTHLGGRNIYTAGDWKRGMDEAWRIDERTAARILWEHAPHAHHCGGYAVHAWPCPTAGKVLCKLLRQDQRAADPLDRTPLRNQIANVLHDLLCDGRCDNEDGPCWTAWLDEAGAVLAVPAFREALSEVWEMGARDGSRGLLPESVRAKRNPYRGGAA